MTDFHPLMRFHFDSDPSTQNDEDSCDLHSHISTGTGHRPPKRFHLIGWKFRLRERFAMSHYVVLLWQTTSRRVLLPPERSLSAAIAYWVCCIRTGPPVAQWRDFRTRLFVISAKCFRPVAAKHRISLAANVFAQHWYWPFAEWYSILLRLLADNLQPILSDSALAVLPSEKPFLWWKCTTM